MNLKYGWVLDGYGRVYVCTKNGAKAPKILFCGITKDCGSILAEYYEERSEGEELKKCDHKIWSKLSRYSSFYKCKKCSWVMTDGGFGPLSGKWFESKECAYQEVKKFHDTI